MTPENTSALSGSGEQEPLSLEDLFNAELSSPTQADAGDSAPSFPTPVTPTSAESPGDPEDLDHEDEEDDVDTNPPETDPDVPVSEDDEILVDVDDDDSQQDVTDSGAASRDAGSDDEPEVTFAELGLPKDLLNAITDMGFVSPTPIQREAIPQLLEGRDVVGVAQTGTGKTAAFGLPLLDAVDQSQHVVQALVLAPTRELALQSAEAISDMAARSRGLNVVAVYGGSPYGPQIGALKAGAQVVVGTPGRVIDLIEKGALELDQVRYFVLDEADEMLRMGFAEDVEVIADSLPQERRTALFSATMPPAIQRVAQMHLTDPVRVEVSRQSSTVSTVHQMYAVVPFRHKVGAVARVLAVTEAQAAIVFVRTKSTAEDVAIELSGRGIQAAAISGDVPQRERERLVERLRSGSLDVLVATDVAARGLDVDRIGLVVNFDVPREAEAYVHRIGRTGRAGRSGEAVTFLTPKEKGKLRQIERLTGTSLEEITLPSPADVSKHRATAMMSRIAERHERGRLDMYRELLDSQSESMDLSVEDIAATLLALAVGDQGPRRREDDSQPRQRVRREETIDADGTFVQASFESGRGERAERDSKRGASRGGRRVEHEGPGTVYRIEVGHRDRALPGGIMGAIANEAGISGSDIGKIDILQSFSLVTVYADLSEEQLRTLGRATVNGRELRMRPDEGPGGGWSGPNARGKRGDRDRGERGERGDRGGFRGGRSDRDGERGGFRGGRDGGRGERDSFRPRRDDRRDDRGGFRGERSERREWSPRQDDRGGYRDGGFRDGGPRGGFRGDRDQRNGRDSYRGGRDERGGYRGKREGGYRDGGFRDGGSRGGFRGDRDQRNGRDSYRGGRDDRGGYRGKRG